MALEATAYRAANYGTPLRIEPSRRSGRFHRAGELPTQYACLHPLGPLAEVVRAQGLPEPEARELRMRTWVLRIDLTPLVEVSFETARRYGIEPADLVSDDHEPCRALADRQRVLGIAGLVVPSAALPGTRNVVLFGERVAAGYSDPVIDAELDVPASMTADPGRPPLSLHALIRRKGQAHAALVAWRSGHEFRFEEPDWAFPRPP
jgi:RES domain-containing protein